MLKVPRNDQHRNAAGVGWDQMLRWENPERACITCVNSLSTGAAGSLVNFGMLSTRNSRPASELRLLETVKVAVCPVWKVGCVF